MMDAIFSSLRRGLRRLAAIFWEAFSQWLAERAPRMAAAIAFYTIFSLAPLLILLVALAGFVFGQDAAQGRIVGQIAGLIGTAGARAVEDLINDARQPLSGMVATFLGIATLLVGATGVFGELQDSLNAIWSVKAKPRGGVVAFFRSRFVSFTMVLGIGFLLLVSLVISAVLSAMTDLVGRLFPVLLPTLHLLDFGISFLVVTALFALLYKLVPDAEIEWRDVWVGAAVGSLLFAVGKLALGFYLGRGTFTSTYGAAGSLVVVLMWVYYSAQILLFGAELTQVFATSRRHVKPAEGAFKTWRPEKRNSLSERRGEPSRA